MSVLYILGTPIGNLGDISFRAVEMLKTIDLLACEDTRHTLKLLNHLGISVRLVSCRSQNEKLASERIIKALDDGKRIAYVSDAGTPSVSDPGSLLVRLASEAGHQVIPIPGCSAFATLISVSGGRDKSVLFEGFLSPKSGRRRSRLKELLGMQIAFVLYESPYRILKLMEDLADLDNERYVCLGREMTKQFEEFLRGSVSEVWNILKERETQKGEFSIFISGKKRN